MDQVENEALYGLRSSWSPWGTRLLALVAILVALSLGYDWVQQFYRQIPVNDSLSFLANDLPWMPIHTQAVTIIGVHYFGDFQLPYAWAINVRHSLSPYLSSQYPANVPPFEILCFIPFTLLSVGPATILFLVISIFVYVMPIWFLLSPMGSSSRIVVIALFVLVSGPFVAMLDRGNAIGIVIGLVSWSVVAWRSRHWYLCGALLVAAISIKVYPVALLVVPIAFRRYRFAAWVLLSAVILNLAALAVIPGGFLRNLRTVVPSMTSMQLGHQSLYASWGVYSIAPKLAGLLFGPSAGNGLLAPGRLTVWLPSLLYLVCIYYIIRRNRVPQWCWGPLAVASIQLIVPQSGSYAAGWVSLGSIWFASNLISRENGSEIDQQDPDKSYLVLRVSMMLALASTLVAAVVNIDGSAGFSVLATNLLSPTLVVVALVIAVIISAKRTVFYSHSASMEHLSDSSEFKGN